MQSFDLSVLCEWDVHFSVERVPYDWLSSEFGLLKSVWRLMCETVCRSHAAHVTLV